MSAILIVEEKGYIVNYAMYTKEIDVMKTIFIVMDSLNRHYLNAYGKGWVKTPNLDRLAEKSTVFDCHYSGSLPCMPARREMMTGKLNFLEAPWGPIELI